MRVLITGAAGFLGSHLVDRFLGEGYEVVGVDNLVTGRRENLAHQEGNPKLRFLEHDVTEFVKVEEPLQGVLHFASPASPVDYLELPIETLRVGSLGTELMLQLAEEKRCRFLLASTSEIYGDPTVHPQPESYWGNVNSIGPRSVYDEAKRYAEALAMAYRRTRGVNTGMVRIFNSIMADETVVVFDEEGTYVGPIAGYVDSSSSGLIESPRRVYVPAFNPQTLKVEVRLANAVIKHPARDNSAFAITTRYGRRIRVTGDHSVFREGKDGQPEPVPVRKLKIKDRIAIPAYLPVVERDVQEINITERMITSYLSEASMWGFAVASAELCSVAEEHKKEIGRYLMQSSRFDGSADKRGSVGAACKKYVRTGKLPVAVVHFLWRKGLLSWPTDAVVSAYSGGRSNELRNSILISDELLWLLGLYVAEGSLVDSQRGDYRILISADEELLDRAEAILRSHFGVEPRRVEGSPERAASLHVDSKVLVYAFRDIFKVTAKSGGARVPSWIMQLPLSRLKYFLEGYREGDGTHTNYPACRELAFNTISEDLATDLCYLLLRFGILGSLGHYETTFRKTYGERKFPFWRVTVCEVSDFNILTWDAGVTQALNTRRVGDLVWAHVNKIEEIESTPHVYDFSVQGFENFVAGSGVFAHNTYGPRLNPADGRVVSNFIVQALGGEPITLYGEGAQTRSFTYVDDLVEGIYRLFRSEVSEPVNLGNPGEFTIRELAELVLEMTGSRSELVHLPMPEDDPKTRKPDITRAREWLGWEPRVSLREGLLRTIPYFQAEVEGKGARARTLSGKEGLLLK